MSSKRAQAKEGVLSLQQQWRSTIMKTRMHISTIRSNPIPIANKSEKQMTNACVKINCIFVCMHFSLHLEKVDVITSTIRILLRQSSQKISSQESTESIITKAPERSWLIWRHCQIYTSEQTHLHPLCRDALPLTRVVAIQSKRTIQSSCHAGLVNPVKREAVAFLLKSMCNCRHRWSGGRLTALLQRALCSIVKGVTDLPIWRSSRCVLLHVCIYMRRHTALSTRHFQVLQVSGDPEGKYTALFHCQTFRSL